MDLTTETWTDLRHAGEQTLSPDWVSVPRAVSWPSTLDDVPGEVHGWYYPPTNPGHTAPGGRAAAADHHLPRWSDLVLRHRLRRVAAVLDLSRLRRPRRQLPRIDGLRPALPGRSPRRLGHRGRGGLRGWGRGPGRPGAGGSASADRARRECRRLHHPAGPDHHRHLHRRHQLLRGRRPGGVGPRHPQVRGPVPGRPDRSVPGGHRDSTTSAPPSTTSTGCPSPCCSCRAPTTPSSPRTRPRRWPPRSGPRASRSP